LRRLVDFPHDMSLNNFRPWVLVLLLLFWFTTNASHLNKIYINNKKINHESDRDSEKTEIVPLISYSDIFLDVGTALTIVLLEMI